MKRILDKLEQEIARRGIAEEEISSVLSSYEPAKSRRIIGGYSSVAVVDREGHRITIPALKQAVAKFMSEDKYRPVQVFHCLTPETKVFVCKGGNRYLPISEVAPGDKVYTHLGNLKCIDKVITHENNGPINELTLENGEIINVTDEHPILTKRGWVKAIDLLITDILITASPYSCKAGGQKVAQLYKGKTSEEIYGIEKALELKEINRKAHIGLRHFGKFCSKETKRKISENRKGKGIGKREHYTLSDKHNSNTRKGRTWFEVYGHNRPDYGGQSHEKNANWKGGISRLPYAIEYWWKKEDIHDRDGRICQNCGTDKNICVHHIDYDKENFSDENLITLCKSCNSKANFNREYWKNFYNNKTDILIHNGTKIISIQRKWYTGKVYNLEIEDDHTYAGKGIIYHNSDIQVGRILPKWTNPDTGETITTHIDDKGWFTVCEIRDDIEIANKVWDEILAGRIRSFSIAGSSKDKSPSWEGGIQHTAINDLEIYETTLCCLPKQKVMTRWGRRDIENIKIGDKVWTHKNRYRKVSKIFERNIDEEVYELSTNTNKTLKVTSEHPLLLKNGTWKKAKDLNLGDELADVEYSCDYNSLRSIVQKRNYQNPSYKKRQLDASKEGGFGKSTFNGRHHTAESKLKNREKHLGKKQSIEQRLKQSIRVKNSILSGSFTPKSSFGIRKDLGIRVRSKYEANFCRLLKYLNIDFEYESKRFKLKNGSIYICDFYLPKFNLNLELKPGVKQLGIDKFKSAVQEFPLENFKLLDRIKFKILESEYASKIQGWE